MFLYFFRLCQPRHEWLSCPTRLGRHLVIASSYARHALALRARGCRAPSHAIARWFASLVGLGRLYIVPSKVLSLLHQRTFGYTNTHSTSYFEIVRPILPDLVHWISETHSLCISPVQTYSKCSYETKRRTSCLCGVRECGYGFEKLHSKFPFWKNWAALWIWNLNFENIDGCPLTSKHKQTRSTIPLKLHDLFSCMCQKVLQFQWMWSYKIKGLLS